MIHTGLIPEFQAGTKDSRLGFSVSFTTRSRIFLTFDSQLIWQFRLVNNPR